MKTTNRSAKFETLKAFCLLFALACGRTFVKRLALNTDAIGPENRLFMGPENRLLMGQEKRLFPGVSMHFSARKLYSWGSGGVKDNAYL